jgi:hypothetical protein
LGDFPLSLLAGVLRIGEYRHAGRARKHVLDQRQPLADEVRIEKRDTGDVSARARVARGNLREDRVGAHAEHDRFRGP